MRGWLQGRVEVHLESIDCAELFRLLGDDELLVLDCRSMEDWNLFRLHIPGALRLSYAELCEFSASLPDDELIVVVGSIDAGTSTARRCARLLNLRGRHAVYLEGGMNAWVQGAYPTERHTPESLADIEATAASPG